MSIRTNAFAAIAGAVILSLGAGCSVFSSDDDAGDEFPSPTRVEGLTRANLVREGEGSLRYTVAGDGTIYVMNAETDNIVFQQRVRRGQKIEVTPEENRIRLDDDIVSTSDLKRDDNHRIYLVRTQDVRRDDDRDLDRGDVPSGIPGSAQLMGSGQNKEISFSPSRDGVVYVYNDDRNRVVSRHDIRDGQDFVLSPGRGRATIDGKSVATDEFDTRTNYRVYFNREDR